MTTLAPASRKVTDNVWRMCGTRAATCRRASDGAHVTLAVRGVDLLAVEPEFYEVLLQLGGIEVREPGLSQGGALIRRSSREGALLCFDEFVLHDEG
jgi:hypothetical protein